MSRSAKERARLRVPIDLTNPLAVVAWAQSLRPILADLRGFAEEATLPPSHRKYSRLFLRRHLLRSMLALDARLDAVTMPTD
jgi:hypothetical protein